MLHRDKFNLDPNKLIVGHPISKIDYDKISESQKYNYSSLPINIGYFGIFTEGIRLPNNYLNSIGKNLSQDFHHNWFINDESRKYFSSYLDNKNHKFNNIIPRNEAIELMVNEMHILLSIGNMNVYQLPSKVIEYLSLGKPVLHYAEIEDDPIYNFEKLFDNLKIIDSKTTKNEIEIYIENIKDRNFEFDVEVFNNYFSALKLVNDLS